MEKLRKCKGQYQVLDGSKYRTEKFELGYFHGWGSNFEEFENGAGNYSVAIVELPDGKIVTPYAADIAFLDAIADTGIAESVAGK